MFRLLACGHSRAHVMVMEKRATIAVSGRLPLSFIQMRMPRAPRIA